MSTVSENSILIIDDQATNLMILKRGLENSGYAVLTAQNGKDGFNLAVRQKPDLILLDIMMPGVDGYEVIRRLKEQSSTANIPVIFLTAREDMESKLKGFELGAVDYVTKPFNIHEVRARVRVHIQLGLATRLIIDKQAKSLTELRDAQNSILIKPEEISNAKFGVVYESLAQAGGDFYEVLELTPQIFGFFVGDVSGHDIATSFVTPALKALLRQNCKIIFSPMEAMRVINGVLQDTLPPGKYLTAAYLFLNRKMNHVTLVNMAHPPVIFKPKDGPPELINLNGDVLGAFADVAFGEKILSVKPGDRFFIYSDGVVERQAHQSVWSTETERLLDKVSNTADIPIQEAVDSINRQIESELGKADDDVVILGLEV